MHVCNCCMRWMRNCMHAALCGAINVWCMHACLLAYICVVFVVFCCVCVHGRMRMCVMLVARCSSCGSTIAIFEGFVHPRHSFKIRQGWRSWLLWISHISCMRCMACCVCMLVLYIRVRREMWCHLLYMHAFYVCMCACLCVVMLFVHVCMLACMYVPMRVWCYRCDAWMFACVYACLCCACWCCHVYTHAHTHIYRYIYIYIYFFFF